MKKHDYKEKYLRALADYHNFEKRVRNEEEQLVRNATKRIIMKLLPVLDNIEKAEVFIKDQGLQAIKKQIQQILEEEGLRELDLVGKEFNPEVAEAIDAVAGEKDNLVIEVLRKGYELNGKAVRPAQVKVTKKHG